MRWYWIVDPERRSVEIHQLTVDHQFELVIQTSSDPIDVPGCPGLALDPQLLWKRIDELGD